MASKAIQVDIQAKDYASATISKVKQEIAGLRSNLATMPKGKTIDVKANTGNAMRKIKELLKPETKEVNVKTNGGGMLSGLGEGFLGGMVGGIAAKGLEMVTTTLKGAVASAKSAFFDYNASLEQTHIAFTSMLGSAEQATVVMGKLKKFAAETPFEFKDIAPAAQQLKAFGFEAEELIPTLTAVGNAAAGLGKGTEGLKQMAFVFGQIRSTGKLMGQDVMQLSALGVPVKDILAKNLGLTAEQLANVGELGIDAKTAIDALVKGMDERFPNMMEKLANSAEGMLSTIRDNFSQLMGKLGEGLFNASKGAISAVRDIMTTMLDNVNDSGLAHIFDGLLPEETGKEAVRIFTAIGSAVDALAPTFSMLKDIWTNLWDVFRNLSDTAMNVMNIFSDTTGMTTYEGALTAIVNACNTGYAVLADFVDLLKAISNEVSYVAKVVREWAQKLVTWVKELADDVKKEISSMVDTVIETWNGMVDGVTTVWDTLTGLVEKAINLIVDTVSDAFSTLYDFVVGIFDAISDVFSNFFGEAGQAFVAFANKYLKIAQEWLSSLYDGVVDCVNKILDKLGFVGDAIRAVGKAVGKAIDVASDFLGNTRTAQVATTLKVISGDTSVRGGNGGHENTGEGKRYPGEVSKGSKGHSGGGASSAAKEAEKLQKKITEATKKVGDMLKDIGSKILDETGTTYEKGMAKLKATVDSVKAEMEKAMALGVDTTALQASLTKYESLMKNSLVKKLKEAREDLANETKLITAKVLEDKRAEAEAVYQIDLAELNRKKEAHLKDVADTMENAEAKLQVEQWYQAQLQSIKKKRNDAFSDAPRTMKEAWKKAASDMVKSLGDKGEQMKGLATDIFSTMKNTMEQSFTNVALGNFREIGKGFQNMLKDMLASLARFLAQRLVVKGITRIFGVKEDALSGIFNFRATGGPVSYGKPYIVGERGPELFVPHQAGRIDNTLGATTGGRAPVVKVIVNNTTNQALDAKAETKFDGEGWVTSVVLNAITTNKDGMRDVIKGVV